MAIQIRCGLCGEVFELEAWTERCLCTGCGAVRIWSDSSSFSWVAPAHETSAQPPRRPLIRRILAIGA